MGSSRRRSSTESVGIRPTPCSPFTLTCNTRLMLAFHRWILTRVVLSKKCIVRGWQFERVDNRVASAEDTSKAVSTKQCRIGDQQSWNIKFETAEIAQPSTPESLLEFAIFPVAALPPRVPYSYRLTPSSGQFSSLVLKHTYSFDGDWARFLQHQLGQLVRVRARVNGRGRSPSKLSALSGWFFSSVLLWLSL